MANKLNIRQQNQQKRLNVLKSMYSENPIVVKSLNKQIKKLQNGK